jgi:hypothetical protein
VLLEVLVLDGDDDVELLPLSLALPLSLLLPLDSEVFELDSASVEDERPLAEAEDERESVMYQPLPLKTIPTG